jgi:hypothetical protein
MTTPASTTAAAASQRNVAGGRRGATGDPLRLGRTPPERPRDSQTAAASQHSAAVTDAPPSASRGGSIA